MIEREIDTMLRELDPTTDVQFDGLENSAPATELFAQLASEPSYQASRERGHRPKRARLAAVGTAAAMVAAAVLVAQPSTPPASAAVNSAAQATADASSGRLDVEVQIASLPESDSTPPGSSVTASLAFDGSDFDLSNEARLRSEGGPFISRVIHVDGVEYVQDGSGPWSEGQAGSSEFVLSPPGRSGEALQALLAQAEDFTQVDNSDGSQTYSGTLGREVFAQTDPDSLPLGMRIIYGPVVPEDIAVLVDVADGRLESVVVHLVGDVENYGFVDITVSSEYSQLGEAQVIEAPQ